ncbi:uncharacterized protein LOC135145954 [Zophobas morio]|uniref:uncharacterized protein LOC135145954 n=1 Tax=Zophobas morio TaxID=2755281 RepID=UPI0030826F0E
MVKTVIVGGGIMGMSSAYQLCQRGHEVTVIERSTVASSASGKAGGFLARDWGNAVTRELHEQSFKLHEQLSKEFGLKTYRKGLPTLQVNFSSKSFSDLKVNWINEEIGLTLFGNSEFAQVTPYEITTAFLKHSKVLGANLIIAAVVGVEFQNSTSFQKNLKGVYINRSLENSTDDLELIEGDNFLFCLGPWSALLESWFPGFRIPMAGI